jgi:hypothetical protein
VGQVTFTTFWTRLKALEKTIQVTSPYSAQVQDAFWGGPPQSTDVVDLPCVINSMTESGRDLGFGARDQDLRISIQLLAAKIGIEDDRSGLLATAFWFAAKDAFDADQTIGSTVSLSVLRGGDPTVPVVLQHGGVGYIGFNAVLEIKDVEAFTFG